MKTNDNLRHDLIALQAKLSKPNIFVFMQNLSYEIRHSNFISWLLDEQETHAQGKLFLDALLTAFGVRYSNKSLYEVNTEIDIIKTLAMEDSQNIEGGKIDIILESLEHVVIIENKTLSSDSKNQLSKYRKFAKTQYRSKEITYLYLTLDGSDPKDSSERKYWKNISYLNIYKGLQATMTKVTCEKTKLYLMDYLDSLGTHHLKTSDAFSQAEGIISAHDAALRELIRNTSKNDQIGVNRALEYVSKYLKKPRGNGFFSTNDIYLEMFLQVLYENGYSQHEGNSSYLNFIPNSFKEITYEYQASPISFSIEYDDKKEKLRFFLGISGIKNKKYTRTRGFLEFREFIIEHKHRFEIGDFDKLGNPNAKDDITVVTKRVPFQSGFYPEGGMVEEIRQIFEGHVIHSVEKQAGTILQLHKEFTENSKLN